MKSFLVPVVRYVKQKLGILFPAVITLGLQCFKEVKKASKNNKL